MTLGVKDLKNISLPAAWDGNELSRVQLRDGTTFEDLARDIETALNVVNSQLNAGYLGRIASLTTDIGVEYRNGGTNGFEDETEQTQPDSQHADTTGHMLPLKKKDRGMKWTQSYLEEARRASIDADIASLIEDVNNLYEKSLWTRFFKLEEETGKANGLGATGVSVGYADGGAGNVDFIPTPRPDRMINTFSTAHNHYAVLNGLTQANLNTAVGHLWEHGVDGAYDLIVSRADLGTWQNTTSFPGFKPKMQALIQYGGLSDLAVVETELYEGAIESTYGVCRLYANSRIPTGYWGVTKSYGQGDQRNPLKVRYDDFFGSFGVKLVASNVSLYPFTGAIAKFRFGVGVSDRVAAVLVEDDSSGTYATPTIS